MSERFSKGTSSSDRPGSGRPDRGWQRAGRSDERGPDIDVSGIVFGEKPASTLFSDVAENSAIAVARAGQDQNKSSQLRRFYDELVMWQEKVGRSPERFAESEPYIQMLKAKVAYAKGRKHVDANFEALMRRLIDQAKDPATLRQAKLFMEAFMAFYKVHGSK